ncbi:helix-turn-helix domain-containing protein [Thalassobius sp. I31.1]|uniref:helix-turn-helix domain-containing protein n=1 Tax=Thalassobius sp. I31.1 TaxID=2109912 RepID=UPI000D1AD3B3|nr:helix-turn-helix domain-containing protein [Thalassobius sp. I31.1]
MNALQEEMKRAITEVNAPLIAKIHELTEKVEALSGDHAGDLLTVAEAAKLKRVTEDTIRRWHRDGKIVSQRDGAKILIPRSALV